MKSIVLALAFLVVVLPCFGQNGKKSHADKKGYPEALFKLGEMATVELDVPESTWQKIITNAPDKTYYECDVSINGERLSHVGIRTKGASSLDDVVIMKSNRYSFTLDLNKFEKGQKYHGLSKLQLNNNIWDATQMKDAIVYDMSRFIGLPAPLTNYARIMLNGEFFGYYLLVEPVEKNFCRRNYSDEETNIYKPDHDLTYKGEDMKQYKGIAKSAKVNGDDASMKRVVAALKSVEEGVDVEAHVDVESVMKYMALQTMVVNFDSMTGHNAQNYCLREANGIICLIPWDYNLAWGGYPDEDWDFDGKEEFDDESSFGQHSFDELPTDAGLRSKEEVSKIVNFPIDEPFSGDLGKRSFFMKLLANEQYKALYYHYLEVLCNQYILGGEFSKTVDVINGEIGTVAGTEANAFYTNEQFHKAQQTLRLVLEKRAASVLGQINGSIPSTWEGQQAQPQLLINSDDINLQDLGGI